MVHCEEVGLGFWHARSTGGGWNGSWQDYYFRGSGNDMQTDDWEGCNAVAVVNCAGEYLRRAGECGTEWHCWESLWRTGVVSVTEASFSALPPHGDAANSSSGVSSAYISAWTDPGDDNTPSCRDIQACHHQDDTLTQFQTHWFVACGWCKSYQRGSEYQDWRTQTLK